MITAIVSILAWFYIFCAVIDSRLDFSATEYLLLAMVFLLTGILFKDDK